VTSLGEELFVVRQGSTQITVYSVSTFTVTRQLQVGVTASWSRLAADSINNCVYMSMPFAANKVYRVELTGSNTVTSWSTGTGSYPRGLSVNSAGNVLVACWGANKIQEYTTTGSLVREISLQSGVAGPMTVVQLSNNQFGVTHAGGSHRYCVVGLNGTAVKCYGGSTGSGVGHMNWAYGFTLNQHGTVFIADNGNNRVLMLNPSTFNATVLAVDGGLQYPYCVHYDKSRDQLYIGEHGDQQRVVVLGK